MTDEEQIAEHILKRGVTRCPTVAVTPLIGGGPLAPEIVARDILRAAEYHAGLSAISKRGCCKKVNRNRRHYKR